jgi:hypothetical protein
VPGDRYVIEPVLISGLGFGLAFSADTYPGGRAIVSGSPLSDRDMGFREGLAVPEPASLSLLGVGLVFVAGRMVRRRRLPSSTPRLPSWFSSRCPPVKCKRNDE